MCGLANLGNTCYLNAVITAVSAVAALRTWLFQHQSGVGQDENHGPCVLCHLAEDVKRIATMPYNEPFRPIVALTRAAWSEGSFANSSQHDAHEAIQKL